MGIILKSFISEMLKKEYSFIRQIPTMHHVPGNIRGTRDQTDTGMAVILQAHLKASTHSYTVQE